MIEPTETESKETLDYFIEVLREIVANAKTNPRCAPRRAGQHGRRPRRRNPRRPSTRSPLGTDPPFVIPSVGRERCAFTRVVEGPPYVLASDVQPH